jgi:RNA polymerase sigma-70 factor (ECF subfamily)
MQSHPTLGRIGPGHGIMAMGRSRVSGGERPFDAWRTPIVTGSRPAYEPPAPSDDRAIVDAVLAGDRDAYRRLVEREGPALVRACHRILGDHAEAEDAAQEAFVSAFRSLSSWRGDGPFGAWLTRIGVRIALRQAGRRRTVTWRDPATAAAPPDAPGQADRAAATEIRTAVATLPEPYREVVALRFFGEASLDEIAHVTGRPLGTVKTHLHRGLARLRASLEVGER